MRIKSKIKDYSVFFESSIDFVELLIKEENSVYVIDSMIYELYYEYFKGIDAGRLFLLDAEEENKVIETALRICEIVTQVPAKRNATLISVGGGITQDITGFVANIIYRGIKWIFVPTTLLAACDSCIGGKTSLNYKKYKNLLGTFYPPDEIHIYSPFFLTLSDKDYKSGLGEVVKFNIMRGETGLKNIEQDLSKLLRKDKEVIDMYVKTSLEYKKTYIEIDEFDRGERVLLNYAHTFGHAIEVVSNYAIPHGTAVAIGMIMVNRVSACRGYLSDKFISRSENLLLKIIDIDIEYLCSPFENYISAIKKDKKQVDDGLTAVLMNRFGEESNLCVIHDLTQQEIKESIDYFVSLYRRYK
ncbi:MAG: hypothetical protein K5868_02315 [Lachnospiraceae bacterium]|nr:hypothetical protein [Lachnospiraceae bacterium]